MTLEQVRWAMAHDWFTGYDLVWTCEVVGNNYRVFVDSELLSFNMPRTSFTNFDKLRKWAGY